MNSVIKVDMHVHTSYSNDSLIHAEDLLKICDRKGIDCVAVTDHNTVEGALKLHELAPSRIIVGEEIRTGAGEITGLFLKEKVMPGMSPMDTIEGIREQGGLVYVPHPFDGMRGSALQKGTLDEIWEEVDIVEVFNSRSAFPLGNWRAAKSAANRSIAPGAGSDAHAGYELGMAYVIVEPFHSAADFLTKLAEGRIHTRRTPVSLNYMVKIYKVMRGIGPANPG